MIEKFFNYQDISKEFLELSIDDQCALIYKICEKLSQELNNLTKLNFKPSSKEETPEIAIHLGKLLNNTCTLENFKLIANIVKKHINLYMLFEWYMDSFPEWNSYLNKLDYYFTMKNHDD